MIHDRKPNRLKGYDYASLGAYYVTICATNRFEKNNVFGKIENAKLVLNETGLIVKKQWEWIPRQYQYIVHDEWVIMPDHIHGIIHINPMANGIIHCDGTGRDRSRPVPTVTATSTETNAPIIKIKPLDQIIGAFKTTSSKMIHQSGNAAFAWQRSYHDHIIRDMKSLNRIRQYIRNNPANWKLKCNDDDCRDRPRTGRSQPSRIAKGIAAIGGGE